MINCDVYKDIEIQPSEMILGDLYNLHRVILIQTDWTNDSIRVEFEGDESPRCFYKNSRIMVSRKIDS